MLYNDFMSRPPKSPGRPQAPPGKKLNNLGLIRENVQNEPLLLHPWQCWYSAYLS